MPIKQISPSINNNPSIYHFKINTNDQTAACIKRLSVLSSFQVVGMILLLSLTTYLPIWYGVCVYCYCCVFDLCVWVCEWVCVCVWIL